jgi:hypothetical protein
VTSGLLSDWPPPGQCYFCRAAPRKPLWTCAFHRIFEAHALVLAGGFLGSRPELPPPDDNWVAAIMDWRGRDESQAVQELATIYWPEDMGRQDSIAMTVMTTGLLAKLAEQGSIGALPDLDSLRLSDDEQDQLLRAYRLREGLFGRRSRRFRPRISDFGAVVIEKPNYASGLSSTVSTTETTTEDRIIARQPVVPPSGRTSTLRPRRISPPTGAGAPAGLNPAIDQQHDDGADNGAE